MIYLTSVDFFQYHVVLESPQGMTVLVQPHQSGRGQGVQCVASVRNELIALAFYTYFVIKTKARTAIIYDHICRKKFRFIITKTIHYIIEDLAWKPQLLYHYRKICNVEFVTLRTMLGCFRVNA